MKYMFHSPRPHFFFPFKLHLLLSTCPLPLSFSSRALCRPRNGGAKKTTSRGRAPWTTGRFTLPAPKRGKSPPTSGCWTKSRTCEPTTTAPQTMPQKRPRLRKKPPTRRPKWRRVRARALRPRRTLQPPRLPVATLAVAHPRCRCPACLVALQRRPPGPRRVRGTGPQRRRRRRPRPGVPRKPRQKKPTSGRSGVRGRTGRWWRATR